MNEMHGMKKETVSAPVQPFFNGMEKAGKLRVSGDRLLDGEGRQVVLHGVNMVCKDKSRGYAGAWE